VTTLDDLERQLDEASAAEGDRYPMLVGIHDSLRAALVETDSDPTATGR